MIKFYYKNHISITDELIFFRSTFPQMCLAKEDYETDPELIHKMWSG